MSLAFGVKVTKMAWDLRNPGEVVTKMAWDFRISKGSRVISHIIHDLPMQLSKVPPQSVGIGMSMCGFLQI